LFRSGSTFTDGRARLALSASSSAFLAPARLPLPLTRLAEAPSVQGGFLALDLLGESGLTEHVAVDFGAQRVTLFQRLASRSPTGAPPSTRKAGAPSFPPRARRAAETFALAC